MRSEYLIVGIILLGLGLLQLWANGRWPFTGSREETNTSSEEASRTSPKGDGLWRSWTRIAGYVAIALGVAAVVLALVR